MCMHLHGTHTHTQTTFIFSLVAELSCLDTVWYNKVFQSMHFQALGDFSAAGSWQMWLSQHVAGPDTENFAIHMIHEEWHVFEVSICGRFQFQFRTLHQSEALLNTAPRHRTLLPQPAIFGSAWRASGSVAARAASSQERCRIPRWLGWELWTSTELDMISRIMKITASRDIFWRSVMTCDDLWWLVMTCWAQRFSWNCFFFVFPPEIRCWFWCWLCFARAVGVRCSISSCHLGMQLMGLFAASPVAWMGSSGCQDPTSCPTARTQPLQSTACSRA